jgi:colanic acid/amylovoran biosynthesis protein
VKVVILNTHSVLNSGDAGIVLAQIRYLKDHLPGTEISLTSRTPNTDKKLLDLEGIKTFPSMIPVPSVYQGLWEKIEKSLLNILDFSSKWQVYREIKNCDLALCSGGGYFYSNRRVFPGPMFLQNFLHAKMALVMNKPLVFLPQSFGPIYNRYSEGLLRDLLEDNRTVKIYTREKISFKFLHHLLRERKAKTKVEICPDMAFLAKRDSYERSLPALHLPRPLMGLTLRKWDFPEIKSAKGKKDKENKYLETLTNVCREYHARWKGSIIIFPQVRGPGEKENDRLISQIFMGKLRKHIPGKHIRFLDFHDVLSPDQMFHVLSQLDLIVSTRFHSALFALICGIPAIAIAYQPKSRGIMEMMNLEHFCLNMSDIDAASLIELLSEILDHDADIKKNIAKEVEIARAAVETKLNESLLSFSGLP